RRAVAWAARGAWGRSPCANAAKRYLRTLEQSRNVVKCDSAERVLSVWGAAFPSRGRLVLSPDPASEASHVDPRREGRTRHHRDHRPARGEERGRSGEGAR